MILRDKTNRKIAVISAALLAASSLTPAAFGAVGTSSFQREEFKKAASLSARILAYEFLDNAAAMESNEGFSKEVISLSYEDALKLAKTEGLSAQSAAASKKTEEATAAGYNQSLKKISDALDAMDYLPIETQFSLESSGVTYSNEKLFKIQSDFAKTHIQPNWDARMNDIEIKLTSAYNGVIQARENVKNQEFNLEIKKLQLKNAEAKYAHGTISTIALDQAKNAVLSAENTLASSKSGYNSARRGLNLLLGYELTQNVELTSPITAVTPPAIVLSTAINDAKKNRNEIAEINYAMSLQEVLMSDTKARYPSSAATYKKQYAAYTSTQLAVESVPLTIETDVRTKATAVLNAQDELTSSENSLKLAKSGYNTALTSYNAGMTIKADLMSSELSVKMAELGVTAATAAYNQAVLEYQISQTVGTSPISF